MKTAMLFQSLIPGAAFSLFAGLACAHDNGEILPPIKAWHGKSEQLIAQHANPWQTPAEATGLVDSPDYAETFDYLKRLADSEPRFYLTSLGKSAQERDIWMLVASSEGYQTPQQLIAKGKPTLFVQGGIHSGEIDGKDAGLMLLRDISKGNKGHLLDNANLLFVPVLSVDGHERRAEGNRVNQRGPKHTGWRTNAHNLNLNRDYTKLDALEMQHLVRALNRWQPDLYFDVHVTNGADYQYDITYGFNEWLVNSPQILDWLSNTFRPAIDTELSRWGHKGGPLVFAHNYGDFSRGINNASFGPRFSHGYGDLRHLPTVLVENHSLKSFRQRVLGTYIFIEKSLQILAQKGDQLAAAIDRDSQRRPKQQVVAWDMDNQNPDHMDFEGIAYTRHTDELTGIETVRWTGEPRLYKDLPVYQGRIAKTTIDMPQAYYIPLQYRDIIQRLKIHGVEMSQLKTEKTIRARQLSVSKHTFASAPFENRFRVDAEFQSARGKWLLPAGTWVVKTDQKLGALAAALLDPRAPDSFFSWGFFNHIFQRTEYIESYLIVPLANRMIAESPKLAAEFKKAMEDKAFASDARAKMRWFYERSPYYDQAYLKYPVLME